MENENDDQQSNSGPSFLSQQDDNISNSKNFQINEDASSFTKRKKVFFIILLLLLLILSAVFFVWKKHLKQDASNTEFTTAITHSNIDNIPKERWSEKDFVLKAVKQDGFYLEYASPELKADKDVVMEAVKQDGRALEYASPKLQADREVVLEAVKQDGRALEYASPKLQADREVVLEAIRQGEDYYNPLEYASKELKANKEVVLEAVKKYGYALAHASPELQADKEVVMEAIKKDAYAFQHASPELRNDKKLKLMWKFYKSNALDDALDSVLVWPIIISILISFIIFITFTIIGSASNNIRAKILIYDFTIILSFSITIFIIIIRDLSIMCDCFIVSFGPTINFILGVILIPWLCYLNHSGKTEENTSKWKMLAYIGIAFGIIIITNLVSIFIGEIFYVSPTSF